MPEHPKGSATARSLRRPVPVEEPGIPPGAGPRGMGRTGMGLTIVHKSDLATRKKNPRVALVLAGGAVTGGAYKLGGLKAPDDFLAQTPELVRSLQEPLAQARRRPTLANLIECVKPVIDAIGAAREFPFPLAYLPSGLFDNASLERYLRHNIDRRGMTNDFRVLYRLRQVELYIVAMNLDTAERVVFGHDEDTSLTISEAVQASTALPGFYKPARLKGVDYVDGGVRRTANIDVAIEHGAELVICYNPFRPFHNRVVRRFVPEKGRYEIEGRPLASQGMLTVLNQVLRTLLHSRLQLGIQQYQDDPSFQGDIILLEPGETDLAFFKMAPLNLWAGRSAGAHGYLSVTQAIEAHYEMIRQILQTYGVLMTRKEVREGLERLLHNEPSEGPEDVLLRD